VIVDFGFAKYVSDKTYTLCGTPLYLPPEVLLNRGHTLSADHWSLGVLIFEMVCGRTPFHSPGMDQTSLFRAIVKGVYKLDDSFSPAASSIVAGFLTKDPAKRLGSLAGREDDVYAHPWFTGIHFDVLRRKGIHAPFAPKIADPLDASNFDDWSHLADKTKTKYPKLTKQQQLQFEKF
jgi:serine/threonine protein kinase